MNKKTPRRDFLGGTGTMAAAGLGRALAGRESTAAPVSPRSIPKVKITRAEPVLAGSDVFVRIETDSGIVGYGDATNGFLPYTVEGALKDLIPYLIGNAPGDVVKPFPTVENSYALPLDGPGLGVTFDEERARAKPFRQPSLEPRLNATDGSVRDF